MRPRAHTTISSLALALAVAASPGPAAAAESSRPPVGESGAPVARFLYVANVGSHNISQYKVASGGQLTPLTPASVAGGLGPLQMAASPDGGSVYVSNFGDMLTPGTSVSQYDVGAEGLLAPKSPPTVLTASRPRHVAVRPDGASVYVINYVDGRVSQYKVEAGGTLTPMVPAMLDTGDLPRGLSVSGDGRNLYVSNFGTGINGNSVSQYDIGADGALTPKDPPTVLLPPGSRPRGNAVSPDGKSVYVANVGNDTISQYHVDAAGRLTPKSPPTVDAGVRPTSVAVSPDGTSAYVTNQGPLPPDNQGPDTISQYDVGPDGTLTPEDPATVAGGDGPTLVTITPDGRNVYVANEASGDVSQYRVGSGGLLEPLSPPTVTAGSSPVGLAVVARVNQPPSCTAVSATPDTILPATRRLETVRLLGAIDPDGDPILTHIDAISQDEPVSGTGIGDPTFPDAHFTAAGADSNEVDVRAERNALGDGRVYHVAFTVTDAHGASCVGDATVAVPRDPIQPAVDSAPPSFNSFTGATLG